MSDSISRPHTACKRSLTLHPSLHSRCPSRTERTEKEPINLSRCSSGLLGNSGKLMVQWHPLGCSTFRLGIGCSHSLTSEQPHRSMSLQRSECRSPACHCSRCPLGRSCKGSLTPAALSQQDKLQKGHGAHL